MPDEASLVPCKICGKKFEKVGFHVRKKHSMSMDDYRNLPITVQEQMPAVEVTATPHVTQNEPIPAIEPVAAANVKTAPLTPTIVEEAPMTPIEEKAEIPNLPWYKRLFSGRNRLLG